MPTADRVPVTFYCMNCNSNPTDDCADAHNAPCAFCGSDNHAGCQHSDEHHGAPTCKTCGSIHHYTSDHQTKGTTRVSTYAISISENTVGPHYQPATTHPIGVEDMDSRPTIIELQDDAGRTIAVFAANMGTVKIAVHHYNGGNIHHIMRQHADGTWYQT